MRRIRESVYGIDTLFCVSRDVFGEIQSGYPFFLDKINSHVRGIYDRLRVGASIEPLDFGRVAILDAHTGSISHDCWTYRERSFLGKQWNFYSIQEWIKHYEREYPLMVVTCCNRGGYARLQSERSRVIYPGNDCGFLGGASVELLDSFR